MTDFQKDVFTCKEINLLIELLFDKLNHSEIYESQRYDITHKGNKNDFVKMFNDFYKQIETHDHSLLIRFKTMYDKFYLGDLSHTYTDDEKYVKWHEECRLAREYINNILKSLIEGVYRKLYRIIVNDNFD